MTSDAVRAYQLSLNYSRQACVASQFKLLKDKIPVTPLTNYLKDYRPVYIQNMACVVTNEDMCSFGYLSVVQTKNFVHNLIYIISA